jgi:mono/diheme cytochrome c family protein
MIGARWICVLVAGLACCGRALAQDAPAGAASRGELLYSVNCLACHGVQMHWREKKLAVDWASLLVQVNRWQSFAKLGWSQDDVAEVARYLNRRYYHYPDAPAAD